MAGTLRDRAALSSAAGASTDARVSRILGLIEQHSADQALGLRELSREISLSPWHLSRLITSATGETFGRLRNAVRIERARSALLSTDLSIKEIAARVGYTHPSDLTRHFRAAHHMSPNAFRAQARAETAEPASRPLVPPNPIAMQIK
jgi:AraC-like DNA-binding protein